MPLRSRLLSFRRPNPASRQTRCCRNIPDTCQARLCVCNHSHTVSLAVSSCSLACILSVLLLGKPPPLHSPPAPRPVGYLTSLTLLCQHPAPGTGSAGGVHKCAVMVAHMKAPISKAFPCRNAFINNCNSAQDDLLPELSKRPQPHCNEPVWGLRVAVGARACVGGLVGCFSVTSALAGK